MERRGKAGRENTKKRVLLLIMPWCFKLLSASFITHPVSFLYLFRTILLRSVHGESLLLRLHFESNIFVVSRSPGARPFAFKHLETLVWF